MVGRIMLLSYSSFKVIDNRRKISDLTDKIVEIYQITPHLYSDKVFQKKNESVSSIAKIDIITCSANLQTFEDRIVQ